MEVPHLHCCPPGAVMSQGTGLQIAAGRWRGRRRHLLCMGRATLASGCCIIMLQAQLWHVGQRTGDWGGADSVCRPSASDCEAPRRPRDRSRSACRSERCSCSRGPSLAPSLRSIHGQCCQYTCSVW
jgi:hypothetical protein